MATIVKRDDGQFQVKIRKKGVPSQSKTFDTRKSAERWARLIEAELDVSGFIDRRPAENTLFADILKRYAEEVSPSKRSHTLESVIINTMLRDPELVQQKMSALTKQVVASWRDRRLKDVSGATVNRELNVLSAVVNHARMEWEIQMENPVALIKRPPAGRARDRRLSTEEERYLLAALEPSERRSDGSFMKGGSRNNFIAPIVLLALETAMRQGEILQLKWEHISLDDAFAHLPQTKNGDPRDVPLSTRAIAILQSMFTGDSPPSEGRVFRTTKDALKKGFSRAVNRAQATYLASCEAESLKPTIGFLDDIHFHDLRHEAITRLAEKLSNILELSAVTGHKDLRMLKRYYHPKASDLAKKLG